MRVHHTKDKGDLGVLHAPVDLARRGYAVLLPLTEHAPFDLVVCCYYVDPREFGRPRTSSTFRRVSLEFRRAAARRLRVQPPCGTVHTAEAAFGMHP